MLNEYTEQNGYIYKDEFKDKTITIGLIEYYDLLNAQRELNNLEFNGVDNWCGYGEWNEDCLSEEEFHDDFFDRFCNDFPKWDI